MGGYQQIKKQLLPFLKGLPLIIGCFVAALFIGGMIVRYSTEKYQSIAKIKLDDQKFGFSSNEIYKDFSMFSLEHRIEAEVELIKSPVIIEKAVDSLELDVEVKRVGSLKETILYGNCPFQVVLASAETDRLKSMSLSFKNEKNFTLTTEGQKFSGELDKPMNVLGDTLYIKKRVRQSEDEKFDLIGDYKIRVFPRSQLVAEISSKIDVKAPDKETPIVRVTYVDHNPDRAAAIVNAVCDAYINDYIVMKSTAASGTVDFIDQELEKISKRLSSSERNLEVFKTSERVVNTTQETETGLREISQLRVDMINLEINERAMRDLEKYIDQGSYFSETAVNFGFGDLVLTELVKKLKMLNDEKVDQSLKYTQDSPQIESIDTKIAEIKVYIKQAVKRNLEDIQIRKEGIKKSYETQSHMFDKLPTREKEQRILERDFMINENVYNFLSKKRIETSILANSMISFHRVIHPAVPSIEPMSPNRTLIKFVSGLLGLLGGIGLVYLRKIISSKVVTREDVEKNSALPFAGVIRKNANDKDFDTLFRSVQMKHKLKSGDIIGVCSSNRAEGKSYVAKNLAEAIRRCGYSCAQVSFGDKEKTKGENEFVISTNAQDIDLKIEEVRTKFDYTLFVGPPSSLDVLAIKVLALSTLGLFLFRSNMTGINSIQEPDMLVEEYQLDNVELLLNGAHKAMNYRGSYIGTRFISPKFHGKNFVSRLKNYYRTYVRS